VLKQRACTENLAKFERVVHRFLRRVGGETDRQKVLVHTTTRRKKIQPCYFQQFKYKA